MTSRALQLSPRTIPSSAESVHPNRTRRYAAPGLALLLLFAAPALLPAQAAPYGYPTSPAYGAYPPQSQDYPPPPPDDQQAPPNDTQQPQPYYQQPQQEYAPPPQNYPQQDQQPYPPQPYDQQPGQQAPQGLAPDQLDQLVAPIALYPDALLAQILAASTFPTQIEEADRWRQQQGDAPPQAIANQANAAPWDPSVKALTAFPQVLDNLARNLSWTTELGNAYYNQPQDVFDAVQDLRQRAQAAGNLQNTPQETVSDDQGYIGLAPANPQVVYVPAYNPWTAYGEPIAPWPGFSLIDAVGSIIGDIGLHFGPGLVMSAFMNMPWGWMGWGLSWLGHCLFYDRGGWYPHSRELADWGLPYGGPRAGWGHPIYGHGYDRGYGRGYDRGFNRAGSYGRGGFPNRAIAGNRGYADARNGFANHSGYGNRSGQQPYSRMPAFNARSGYGSAGGYNRSMGSEYGRTSSFYGRSQQAYRSPSENRGYSNSFRQPQSSFRSSGSRSSGSWGQTNRAYSGASSFGRNSFSGGSRGFSESHSQRGFFGGNRGGSSSHSSFGGGHSTFGGGSHFGGGRHFSGGHSSHFGGGGHSGGGHSSHGGGGHRH
ncbi:MAG: DUF3300 domain-containing protein [Acidobacteriaceae bacterium]